MRFSITRKLNLANIDKEMFAFETEDIGVQDCDSFDEASQMCDRLVAERTGYYRAKVDTRNKTMATHPALQVPLPSAPSVAFIPPATPPYAQPQTHITPSVGRTPPGPITSQPPADLA